MTYSNETSISAWVKALQSEPFYAILSGFIPACYSSYTTEGIGANSIPGVSTFYDFTACDSFYSLPIYIKFVSAARHDSVTGVYACIME